MFPQVLFVLTSHKQLGNTGRETGWYLPDFAHPFEVLAPHADITVASPAGGEAPIDPWSIEASKDDEISRIFFTTRKSLWMNTIKLESLSGNAKFFDAIIFVGGRGPMFDLANDPVSHSVINELHKAKKIIAAVCHGSAALAEVRLRSGEYLLHGAKVTGFSNSEEKAVGLTDAMPFSLEDKLNEASGGKYQKAANDWEEKVVMERCGKFITGQNPASAAAVGRAILAIFAMGGWGSHLGVGYECLKLTVPPSN